MYTIFYTIESDPYASYTVDWDSLRGRWIRFRREQSSSHWEDPEEGIDEAAYLAILERFGLDEWKEEFPMDKVVHMSHIRLAKERREKEKHYNLPKNEWAAVLLDTLRR